MMYQKKPIRFLKSNTPCLGTLRMYAGWLDVKHSSETFTDAKFKELSKEVSDTDIGQQLRLRELSELTLLGSMAQRLVRIGHRQL